MTKRSPSVPAKKIDAAELMRWIDEIEQRALEAVADVQDPDRLATQTAIYLGRGGELNGALEHLTDLTKAERAEVGRRANQVKTNLEAEYGLTGGHPFHGELALDQLFLARPLLECARYRTPIRGLFLCGAGTHPGNGLTGASGRNAAREIRRALRR